MQVSIPIHLKLLLLFAVSAICFILGADTVLANGTPVDVIPGPGDQAAQPDGNILTGINANLIIISTITTGVTYVINHFAPWASEQIKGTFLFLFNAAIACVYQILSDGSFGANEQTLVAVLTAVGVAAFSHGLIFKPAGLNTFLGGGTNKDGTPSTWSPGLSNETAREDPNPIRSNPVR